MAQKKFTELPSATTPLTGAEIIAIVQDGVSKRTTVDDLPAGAGGGTWGSITGTLSNQTDLQAALDLKANKALSLNPQTGDYTPVIGDADTVDIRMNGAVAQSLTIPPNASVAFPVGTILYVTRIATDANPTTFVAGAGVTLVSTSGALTDAGRYVQMAAKKTATNTWEILNGVAGGGGGTVTSVGFTGGLISVANPTTTPAFTVAGTSGGVPYFSSSSTWASSAALAANALVIGGGAGAAPATVTTGTGVLTALAVNVGSAGAFVTFDGAGGTPSSITLTNGTGLPISGITGLGTNVGTWLATPSWTNFSAAITGTAPYWATTGTSTLTGTTAIAGGTNPLTFTNNIQDGFRQTATFTTTANNQQLALIDHTITTRNSASDVASSVAVKPVFTAGAASQILYGLSIDMSGSNFATNSPTIYALNAVGGGVFTQTSSALSPLALLVNRTSGNGSIMEVQSNSTAIFRISNGANSTAVSILPTGTLTTALNLGGTVTTSSGTGNLATLSGTLTAGANNDVLRGIRGIPVFGANTRTNVVAVGYYHNPSFTISSGSWAFQGGIVIDNTTSGVNLLNGFNLAPGSVLSTVDIDGSVGVDITSTSTDITANATHHTILVDASGAARTITLPTAASSNRRVYVIKKTDSSGNTVTIDGDGSETIDGATTNVISAQWSARAIQSNGTAWFVIASF